MNNLIELGARIKKARLSMNMTQEQLAELLGYTSRSTINKIELGKIDIPQSKLEDFAKVLNVDPVELMGWSKDIFPINEWKQIPVYSRVSCGNGCFDDSKIEEYIAVPSNLIRSPNSFGVYANGDSMINAGIINGEILIFNKSDEVLPGDIVCACYDGSCYCKRYKLINNSIVLVSENPNYDPIIIDEAKGFTILGKLVYSVKKY